MGRVPGWGGEARAPAERVGGGAHGWNVGYGAHRIGGPAPVRLAPSVPPGGWVVGVGSGRSVVGVGVGTLLGPEGAGESSLLHADHRKHLPLGGGCVRVGSSVA